MTMSTHAPQAYTRETLAKAFAWLRHQNDQVKEMAQSADNLVALYLKAQRSGGSAEDMSWERPSVQSFKNELKSLAGIMGEFEGGDPQTHSPTNSQMGQAHTPPAAAPGYAQAPSPAHSFSHGASHVASPSASSSASSSAQSGAPNYGTNGIYNGAGANFSAGPGPTPQPHAPPTNSGWQNNHGKGQPHAGTGSASGSGSTSAAHTDLRGFLDPKSWAMIHEVKNALNLSHEQEALRFLLTLGYNQTRKFLET
jgi:hypothetical protein